MAETKKRASTKKKTGAKRGTSQRTKGQEQSGGSPYRDEITLVVTLVASLLIILSYFNLCGVFGTAVNFVLFGLFGFTAYLVPVLLFFGVAFAISNRGIISAKIKIASSCGLYLILMGIVQLITNGNAKADLVDMFLASSDLRNGGGLIGGAITKGLCYIFGVIGTYIVFLGIAVILIMLITEKFLFAFLRERRKESAQRRAERVSEMKAKQTVYRKPEDTDSAASRKPAKVFTFSKEDKENIKTAGLEPEETKKGKKKGKKKDRVKNEETKETVVTEAPDHSDLDNLSILRGYEKKESEQKEKIPVYEEELQNKFGTAAEEDNFIDDIVEENMEPVVVNANQGLNLFDMEIEKATDIIVEEAPEESLKSFEGVDSSSDEFEAAKEEFPEEKSAKAEAAPETMSPPEHTKGKAASEHKKEEAPTEAEKKAVSDEIGQALQKKKKNYVFPSLELLSPPKSNGKSTSDTELRDTAAKLKSTLDSFGVKVEMKNVSCGPTVTRYELQPAQGVKVSKITSLTDDIKLSLAAADIRIEAPIPGKSAVGIEVPNKEVSMVYLRSLLESKEFKEHKSDIAFAVGKDIGGNTIVTDIAKMPHLLIAGATGSGKSVCINTLIMSILYKANPDDVKLIMVDPKVVELSVYNGIPHLLIPVVTDPKKASGALNWAVMEMTERYKKFADLGVRDIKGYNAKVAVVEEDNDERFQKMPQIVIIVDELADLMMVAPGEVEDAICRLAQLARAAGIHLIIATQRPSVNVITGLIKANVPSRIAFAVSSAIDSRTILDGGGAEKLLGNGDMLFFPSGYPKPVRVQGSYVSDKEVSAVVNFLTSEYGSTEYSNDIDQKIASSITSDSSQSNSGNERDEYFVEAGRFIIEKDKASIGMLQRVYKIGFNRAARIMDQLYDAGVVGPEEGTKPRKVVMSAEEFEQYIEEYV